MMDTYTSITYSKNSSSKDCCGTIEKLEYNSSIQDNDKLMRTSYVNTMNSLTNDQYESFNKLLKNRNDLYEQVGSSHNRSDWNVKEFHNAKLNKEYNDAYSKHNFDQALLECLPGTVQQPFIQLKNKLLN
jgi:hypothetical protein